jgi:hypothetical protein
MGVALALAIPAMAYFFMGSSKTKVSPAGGADSGGRNEEPSKSVPAEQPPHKETKPASTKAVVPDGQRLDTEVRAPPFAFPFRALRLWA